VLGAPAIIIGATSISPGSIISKDVLAPSPREEAEVNTLKRLEWMKKST